MMIKDSVHIDKIIHRLHNCGRGYTVSKVPEVDAKNEFYMFSGDSIRKHMTHNKLTKKEIFGYDDIKKQGIKYIVLPSGNVLNVDKFISSVCTSVDDVCSWIINDFEKSCIEALMSHMSTYDEKLVKKFTIRTYLDIQPYKKYFEEKSYNEFFNYLKTENTGISLVDLKILCISAQYEDTLITYVSSISVNMMERSLCSNKLWHNQLYIIDEPLIFKSDKKFKIYVSQDTSWHFNTANPMTARVSSGKSILELMNKVNLPYSDLINIVMKDRNTDIHSLLHEHRGRIQLTQWNL